MGEEKKNILKVCDIAIINPTGASEAFPATPLECMAMGLPVITSRDYGMYDVMKFMPELVINRPAEIISKIDMIMGDEKLYELLRNKSLSIASFYINRTNSIINSWELLFDDKLLPIMKYNKRTLTEHINTEYRNYAIHALENRGIPNFYDSITPVQRFIIQSAPSSFEKTASVVGDVIRSGYHHGPASLENAINGITRNFLCSNKILDGDGFFGNPINTDAAASRYTSIRLNPKTKEILNKYSKLNSRSEIDSDSWNPLKVEIPLGLCVQTNGVGVGYACFILPRKLEHIIEFFEGKRKSLKPYLLNFDGKITKNKESQRSSWIIEPFIESNTQTKVISIKDISPIISYPNYIKKINSVIEKFNCKFENNTREKINIELKFAKEISSEEFNSIYEEIKKFSTSNVTENIVIIKDSSVLEYNCIEDYLEDFSRYREFLFLEKIEIFQATRISKKKSN
jgi:DNA topoisomerase-2